VEGRLAAKSVRLLASLENVDIVLVGIRSLRYVVDVVPEVMGRPALDPAKAKSALQTLNTMVQMWLCMASEGADDHGTAKDWRLPTQGGWGADRPKGYTAAVELAAGDKVKGA